MISLKNIRGLLLDLEGVVYVGEELIDGAVETINDLQSQNLKIKYLTNTTTIPRKLIMEKLKRFNLPTVESDIFSPVIAANNFLKQKGISRICLLANQSLQTDFENVVFDENNPEAVILGDIYKKFNWERLNKAFQLISEKDAILIALHKNKYCRREGKLTLDLGPFVQALEYASSKKAVVLGKPEKNFFKLVLQDMSLSNNEVIMIGDDILADIAGAKNNNITTIQVKTGKYQQTDESDSYVQPDFRINSIVDLPNFFGTT
jgi:HAD superfamily hydrolase (TIGR01458 family)